MTTHCSILARNLVDRGAWWAIVNAVAAAKLLQSCPTLCDGMDYSLQGSSVHGIFQARVLAPVVAKLLQSCLTRCNPKDSSPPGAAVPGILQARTLEWVSISFSRGSSQARD